jgi:Xaa-Pro aminopeptidase
MLETSCKIIEEKEMIKSISAAEFKERIKRVQGKMAEEKFDIIITFGDEAEPQYVRYLSDYFPSFETAGVFIPIKGEPALLIGPESLAFSKAWSKIPNIKRLKEFRESSEPEYPGEVLTTFKELFEGVINSGSNRRIGVVGYPLMPVPIYESIVNTAKMLRCEIVRAEELLIGLKQIKGDEEVELMKNAASISEKAFENLLKIIKPGMTEIQVVGEVHKLMRDFGAEGEAYPFWCISGENTNQAISRPTHKELKRGELIQLCMGARLGGYASSFGRPLVFGDAPKDVLDLMKIGLETQKTVIRSLKAGVEAKKIDAIYREFLKQNSAAECMLYGPCHGVGLMEGEHPWIEKTSDFQLQENMTFCVDIFLQRDGFGLRCEDVVRVTKDGAEEFTTKFKEVLVL